MEWAVDGDMLGLPALTMDEVQEAAAAEGSSECANPAIDSKLDKQIREAGLAVVEE